MAKILNKDPVTYQRERDGFIRDLQHFHETRGTPFRKIPKINGHEIDLYLLYVLVTAHGGWVKVNSRNEWESLVDHFTLPKHCVNCGVGLKQIYLRYLDRYEKVHYLGEDVDRGSDDDEESRHRRWSARALHSVPLTYNHHQHNVADGLRSYNGLSSDLYKPSDYDRLALSLMSPLPNEQDFAINVCTLLSNEGKHTLKLDKYPRLVDFLLAHAGIFNHSTTRELFEEVYGNIRRHSLRHFWLDALADADVSELADETLFPTKKPKVKEVICDGKEADGKESGGKESGVKAGTSGAKDDNVTRSSSRCSERLVGKTVGDGDVVEKMEVDSTPQDSIENTPKANDTPKTGGTSQPEGTPKVDETPKADGMLKTDETEKADGTLKAEETPCADGTLKTDEIQKAETTQKTDETPGSDGTLKTDEEAQKADGTLKTDEAQKADGTLKTEDTPNADVTLKTDETEKADGTLKTDETQKVDGSLKADETSQVDDAMKMDVEDGAPKADDTQKMELGDDVPKVDETPKREEREGMVDSSTSMEVDVDMFVDECAGERTGESKERYFEEGEDGLLCEVEKTKTESKLKIPLNIENSDFELFCLGRSFGTQDYIGQRVLQVATILRNLSFGEENVGMLARNGPFLRFLLLCASSRWNCLHQLGLDMLGNIASEVLLEDPSSDRLAASLLSSVTRGLHSQDRLIVLSCLEVLNKLSQKDENEDIMLRCLDQRVYDQVCTFLTLHDIMLLIYTLECLYSLSSLGERACNCIVRVHGAIDTLVSLITVEAQSYGPKACILMRVVETVSGTQAGTTSTTTTTTTTTAMAAGAANSNPSPVITAPVRTPVIAPSRQTTPQRMVIGAPQPAVATPVTLTMSQTPQQYQQQQHAHQQAAQENEQFALAWLRATYEPATGCRIEQGELYKQYLTACAKIGRRGVIAPLHFPRCVRSVFGGTVGPNPQKQAIGIGAAGTDQSGMSNLMFYEGIKVRATPFTIPVTTVTTVQQPPSPQQLPAAQTVTVQVQQRKALNVVTKTVTPPPVTTSPIPETAGDGSLPLTATPASPILKAQLSAPPKPRETPKGDVKSQVLAHPHLTQALLGSGGGSPSPAAGGKASAAKEAAVGGPPTSLIKSLLATKVNAAGSECMMPAACSATTTTTTTTASTSTKQPPPTPQVTQRQQQQRLLQQQLQTQIKDSSSPPPPSSQSNNVQGKGVIALVSAKGRPATTSAVTTSIAASTVTTTVVKSPDPRQRTSRINGARTPLQQTTPLQAQTQTQTQAIAQAQTQTQTQMEQVKEGEISNSVTMATTTTTTVITSTNQCAAGTSVITQVPTRIIAENHVPSPALAVGGGNLALRGRREPPQPPPPPLAPLSNSRLPPRLDIEDSDSTGNNSLASSSRDCSGTGAGNISSTDDGENSLTSFEGLLLNGIPHSLDIDAASNDSSSKDSARSSTQPNAKPIGTKSLMLADLLEKKVDKKEPPILNGVLGKELRIGEKGLELVENHLEKVLKESSGTKPGDAKEPCSEAVRIGEKSSAGFKTVGIGTTDEPLVSNSVVTSTDQVKFGVVTQQTQTVQGVKRAASDNPGAEDGLTEAKRPHLSPESVVNGTTSPEPPTVAEENNPAPPSPEDNKSTASNASGDNSEVVNASPSAANLYAALAASALEDEPDLELPPPPPTQVLVQSASGLRQAVFLGQGVDSAAQQQLIVTAAPRQIIVSQGQLAPQGQVLITAGGQITLQQGPNAATATIKTPSGHQAVPVLVQTGGSAAQRTQISAVTQGAQLMQTGQVMLSQSSSGQFILSQAAQGQVQLVQAGGSQGGQYIVSAGGSSGQAHYVVAQPQTALVQGQTQTVLVAQTPQQQGTGTKTIIILQPQTSPAATHHQKVVVTPQGQPVVVTQVPRPILQSPAISNPSAASIPPPALVPTSSAMPSSTSPQPMKHTSTIVSTPVHMASRGSQPTLVTSTGTSTSLPASQSQSRSITPTSSSSNTMAPISPSAVTTSKTSVKAQMVHPTPAVPRPSVSPTPGSLVNSTRGTPIQIGKQMRVMPSTRPSPIGSPLSDGSGDKSTPQMLSRNPKISGQPTTPQTRLHTDSIFLCEWRGCMRSFKSANEVYMHACEAHCPLGSEEIQCLWERCDAMKRKRFSLMTHLYDRHCNADVLRMMAVRRRQLSQSGRSEIPPPQPPPPHPGYAPNAAFHAIKRHALEFVNPKEMMDDNEGPVTKSIRLTSSLILRNLVIYSTNGRRFLRSYEPHLASVALSNVESSRTIAQVLYDMNQQSSQR